ncbi:hypothetical protein LEP1GSC186_4426 [Leptospira noguchii serovar Autumnalis str. ZUN142]|uniref:Uncharacterized protein n=1 Tax=Leptospira noguchii serovar Autumnalis str. ZUN142 TaxID=1085540 RepID=M6UUS2_9LEPT|nr:hypothetical protein LEP1GSC186_4426 [Leptospira noguchii serovar Autumnalis str. ZUN142]
MNKSNQTAENGIAQLERNLNNFFYSATSYLMEAEFLLSSIFIY